jgi:ISXO2-like transposase domain/Transposase zinc-ribbon domain
LVQGSSSSDLDPDRRHLVPAFHPEKEAMKLIDVHKQFDTNDKCLDYLEAMRWPSGVCCIACGSLSVSRITREAKSKNKRTRIYQCLEKECKHQFSPTAGTIFHDSHLPLEKWFMAIALILEGKKGVSALQICRNLGIDGEKNYRPVWHLCHRIRQAMAENRLVLDAPAVEADETYVGSKIRRPRHARPKTKPDDVVLGMVERGGKGRVKLIPIADSKNTIMKPHLERHISERVGVIYTDGHPIYVFALKGKFSGKHETIDHKRTYAIGSCHTNTIENAFSLFKKGLYGSFHHVSKKHLARYCNEFSYRFNRRNAQPEMFAETVKGLLREKPLTLKNLVSGQTSES